MIIVVRVGLGLAYQGASSTPYHHRRDYHHDDDDDDPSSSGAPQVLSGRRNNGQLSTFKAASRQEEDEDDEQQIRGISLGISDGSSSGTKLDIVQVGMESYSNSNSRVQVAASDNLYEA